MLDLSPDLVVLEATGGYEQPIVIRLADAGLSYYVANGNRVRAYAKALGFLAKTDAIDAYVIARFGRDANLEPRSLGEQKNRTMQAFLARRRQIVNMCVSERNRVKQAPLQEIRQDIQEHLQYLKAQLNRVDAELDRFIQENPVWAEKKELDLFRNPAKVDIFALSSFLGGYLCLIAKC